MAIRALVRLLGPLEVEVDGVPVEVSSRVHRLVLVALALAGGTPVSVARLVDVVWGDAPPKSMANSLQSHIARLRGVLGDPGLVRRQPPGYRLAIDPDDVDLHRAERLINTARELPPADARASLDDALGLWRGDDLAGLDDHPFEGDHEHARRLRVDAHEARAGIHLDLGDVDAARRDVEFVLADEPLRSSAVGLMVRALAAMGRTADADAVYQRHRVDLGDQLGLDPPAGLRDLHTALLRDDLPGPAALEPTAPQVDTAGRESALDRYRPPRPRTALLGRTDDLATTQAQLAEAALVTIVGPGGVGKTALALEVVDRLHVSTTVRWVDLADARDATDVYGRLALVAGTASPSDPASNAWLVEALGSGPQILLMDNCEPVIEVVATLVEELLGSLPDLQVFATSREPLGVVGEHLVRLSTLPVDATADNPAVALFLDRAGPTIAADDPSKRQLVVDLAGQLDGLPLAIELAARQVASLGLDAVHQRLENRLDLLVGLRSRHPAHRDLRSLIRWSTDLLTEEQRQALYGLSTFAGEFTLEMAEGLLGELGMDVRRVAAEVAALVERSLVLRVPSGRHRFLDTIRAVAREDVQAVDRTEVVQAAHVDTMVALLDAEAEALRGPGEADAVTRLNQLVPDLQAAVSHVRALADHVRAAGLARAVRRYAYNTQRLELLAAGRTAVDLLDRAEKAAPEVRQGALLTDAVHAMCRGDFERAVAQSQRILAFPAVDAEVRGWAFEVLGDVALFRRSATAALEAYRDEAAVTTEGGHVSWRIEGLTGQALVHAYLGDHAAGQAAAVAQWQEARTLGNPSLLGWGHFIRAELAADRDPDLALEHVEQAITMAASVDNHMLGGAARSARSSIRARHGDPTEALVDYRAALEHWRRHPNPTLQTTILRNLAVLFARIGQDEPAAVLDAAAAGDTPLFPAEQQRVERARRAVNDRLGSTRAGHLRRSAADLTMEQLVVLALDAIDEAAPSNE